MDDQQIPLAETIIKIEAIPPEPDDKELFENLLERYVKDLLEDLGLKTAINLNVNWITQTADSSSKTREVFVNGKACRTPFASSIGHTNMTGRSLAGWAVEAIVKNAELLVPLSLSNTLRDEWSAESEACFSHLQPDAFNKLLVSLVRRGCSVERVKQIASNIEASESKHYTEPEILEMAIGSVPAPIGIVLPKAIDEKSADKDSRKACALKEIQETIFYDLGISIPTVDCRVDAQLNEHEFRIRINDVRSVPFGIVTEASPYDPLSVPDPWNQFTLTAISVAKLRAGGLLTMRLLDQQVDLLRTDSPDLVELTLHCIEKQLLLEILRDLLDEGVSIRDIRRIFEGLVALNGTSKVDHGKYIVFPPYTANLVPVEDGKRLEEIEIGDYSNWVRLSLNRTISNQFVRGNNTVRVYLLEPKIEERLKRARQEPLTPEETRCLHEAIHQEVGSAWLWMQDAVILTTIEVRRQLSELIELEFPHLPVLCYQELTADLNIQPIARISWS